MKQKIFRSLFYIFGFYVLILAGVQMSGSGNLGLTNGRLADPPESPNCVSSHADVSDIVHYIEPLAFSGSAESAAKAIQKVIDQWPRTKVITKEENYYHLVCTTFILRFKDDLEIYVDKDNKEIHFRSASRIGYSDLGTNRKRVNILKETLKPLL